MNKFVKFFDKHRLLDGYISILGVTFWYKLLAGYSTWFFIWDLSLSYVFSFSCIYHTWRGHYPLVTFSLKLFKHTIFDTGAKAAKITSDEVAGWTKERKEKELAEIERIAALEKRVQECDEDEAGASL